MQVFVLQHGKKIGFVNGQGPPPPNTIGEVFAANLSEPINPLTVDSTTAFTADNTTWPTADVTYLGAVDAADANRSVTAVAIEAATATDAIDAAADVLAVMLEAADAAEITDAISIVSADAIEAANAFEDVDATSILSAAVLEAAVALDDIDAAVGANIFFASVVEAADAADILDADVIAAEVPVSGGGFRPKFKPAPVYGVGFGILPELRGEAHGVVTLVGTGAGILPSLVGEAAGSTGVAGRSAGQLVIRAAALGASGQAGAADAVLKGLSLAGSGAIVVCGSGSGVIVKFTATAGGHHDDDEAAVMTFLFAA